MRHYTLANRVLALESVAIGQNMTGLRDGQRRSSGQEAGEDESCHG
jgi:hypothetical protein